MKTRKWKMAGALQYGLELHYRVDDGELDPKSEAQLLAAGSNVVWRMGRDAVAKVFAADLTWRDVDFVIAPRGEMVLLESDVEPHVIAGFLASVGLMQQGPLRPH